jgi:3-oxoacyl-[acyl-carrier-protein] synthase III
LWKDLPAGQTWGLCAFGGGFTFGGAVMRTK